MTDYERKIRETAEFLYKIFNDPHDHSVRAVWDDDSWNVNNNSDMQNGIRDQFYNKSLKLYICYEEISEVKKMVNFMNEVNPKVLKLFIEQL